MKKVLTLALFVLPVAGLAQERAPELPSIRELRERAAQVSVPDATASASALPASSKAADEPAALVGAVIDRGAWAGGFGIDRDGRHLGTITDDHGGYVIRNASGDVLAQSEETKLGDDRRDRIVDASGKTLGVISETYEEGCSAFEVFDDSSKSVGITGCLADSEMISLYSRRDGNSHPATIFHARWTARYQIDSVGAPAADSPVLDSRVAAVLAVMTEASDCRHAAERGAARANCGEGD